MRRIAYGGRSARSARTASAALTRSERIGIGRQQIGHRLVADVEQRRRRQRLLLLLLLLVFLAVETAALEGDGRSLAVHARLGHWQCVRLRFYIRWIRLLGSLDNSFVGFHSLGSQVDSSSSSSSSRSSSSSSSTRHSNQSTSSSSRVNIIYDIY